MSSQKDRERAAFRDRFLGITGTIFALFFCGMLLTVGIERISHGAKVAGFIAQAVAGSPPSSLRVSGAQIPGAEAIKALKNPPSPEWSRLRKDAIGIYLLPLVSLLGGVAGVLLIQAWDERKKPEKEQNEKVRNVRGGQIIDAETAQIMLEIQAKKGKR